MGQPNPLHAMWSTVAPSWDRYADFIDDRGAGVTQAMLSAVDVQPGDRVLELGCGPGGLGIAAAKLVGTEGRVVLSDVSPEMAAIAAERAERLGLRNVDARQLDMEHIDAADSSFDKVFSREALMLVADPTAAAREALRVLRSGGGAAFSVWGPPTANPWLSALLDAVGSQLGAPVPPPGVPGPFSLSAPGALATVLTDAGFDGVDVREVDATMHVASLDEWWEIVPSLAGPVAALLASLPDDVRSAIRDQGESVLTGYAAQTGYAIPGKCLVGVGRAAV
ncbi:methyltransferase domain-containing protein [Mycobacterium sp. OAE908]|uniref:class I SAM-dependent methyltransferase n=1 Tax=Mycobacterium sp. OAE908 TaxID=2817899 RepID=UPI001AE768B8